MYNKDQYDYLFKFIIVGNISVGKSCLLMRFADNHFKENHEATIGVDFGSQIINEGGTGDSERQSNALNDGVITHVPELQIIDQDIWDKTQSLKQRLFKRKLFQYNWLTPNKQCVQLWCRVLWMS